MALPTVGNLEYAGINFDSLHRTKVSTKVVYDAANRMQKWVEISIDVEAYIAASDSVATWRALTEPGGTLKYTGKGFGSLQVNAANQDVRDVNYGPKPELFEFTPIGADQRCFVHWRVTTCLPSCANAQFKDRPFDLTFEVTYDHDRDGYLTLSVNGGYEIPTTFPSPDGLTASPQVVASADTWWKKVCPIVPLGFIRDTKTRKVSKDRRRVDFNIVDKELPAPLLPGCTMIEAKQKVKGAGPAFVIWNCSISGTVRANPNLPRSTAWDRFSILLMSRLRWIWSFTSPLVGPQQPQAAIPTKASMLLVDMEFEEDIFGKDARFSCAFKILGSSLRTILRRSGLWLPVPGADHAAWKLSQAKNTGLPYGKNGAFFAAEKDILINLCEPKAASESNPYVPLDKLTEAVQATQQTAAKVSADEVLSAQGGNINAGAPWVHPDSSWLHYATDVHFAEDDNIVRHKPLAGTVTVRNGPVANGPADSIISGTYSHDLSTTWDTPDIIQRVCSPDADVVLSGSAIRFGYRINPPRIDKFGGKDVTQGKKIVRERMVGIIQGVPIWGLVWHLEYTLAEPVLKASTLVNPAMYTHGSP